MPLHLYTHDIEKSQHSANTLVFGTLLSNKTAPEHLGTNKPSTKGNSITCITYSLNRSPHGHRMGQNGADGQ